MVDTEVLGWVAPAIGCMLANVMFLSPYKVRCPGETAVAPSIQGERSIRRHTPASGAVRVGWRMRRSEAPGGDGGAQGRLCSRAEHHTRACTMPYTFTVGNCLGWIGTPPLSGLPPTGNAETRSTATPRSNLAPDRWVAMGMRIAVASSGTRRSASRTRTCRFHAACPHPANPLLETGIFFGF
jgi:hypothetical protein